MILKQRVAGTLEYLAILGHGNKEIKLTKEAFRWPTYVHLLFDISSVYYTLMVLRWAPLRPPSSLHRRPLRQQRPRLLLYARVIMQHEKGFNVKEVVQGVIED